MCLLKVGVLVPVDCLLFLHVLKKSLFLLRCVVSRRHMPYVARSLCVCIPTMKGDDVP